MMYQGIDRAGPPAVREQLFGEHLKEGLVLHRRDRIFTLGPVIPQPRSLPAGDKKRRDFPLAEQLPPALSAS